MNRSFLMLPCFVLTAALALCQQTANQPVIGTWEGESTCTVPNSPCHDEHVVYDISEDKKEAGRLEVAAYKIVSGEKQYMGSLSCEYAAAQSELRCHYRSDDLWLFSVKGQEMKGTLTIKGDTLYRRISVKKKPA